MIKKKISEKDLKGAVKDLCIVIHPFTPHLSEEIWELLGNKSFCANTEWPKLIEEESDNSVKLPVQVNGKLKGLISSKKEDPEDYVLKKAHKISAVENILKNSKVIKTIYIPGKILNIVIK